MKIGILALQGDFERHQVLITNLNVDSLQVRQPHDLEQCQGLIIPGGESTTLIKLIKETGLFQLIPKFGEKYPIFGTCAGLILLAKEVVNNPVESFGLIDVTVERNAYGRQINSFIGGVDLELNGKAQKLEGVFIRAPKIVKIGEGVKILGKYYNEIVIVEKDKHLASTFHPELSDSRLIHQYFLSKVKSFVR